MRFLAASLRGEAQVADYDHHYELAFLLWEQQLTSPPAQVYRTPPSPQLRRARWSGSATCVPRSS